MKHATHEKDQAMKIIRLSIENIKRLKAVEITPDGTVQIITGKNAAGKTSVLDAIWLALGGGPASRGTVRPIRDGEDHASVTLDLGDLIVTRTWKGDKTTLTVTAADGAKYSSPQSVLDSLVGRLSWSGAGVGSARSPRARSTRSSSPASPPATNSPRSSTSSTLRPTSVRWSYAAWRFRARQSASDLIAKIREAGALIERQDYHRQQLAEAETKVEALRVDLGSWEARLSDRRRLVEEMTPEPDVAAMEAELDALEETNRAVRRNAEIAKAVAHREELEAQWNAFTKTINDLDKAKADALAKAEFPVDGLGFDENGVTYQGVPFSQASSAEQIRVSLAMAMALNPKLRVIRILDGSLLDADNLALITEMAAGADFQIWLEKVADGSGVGVVIEDGAVA